MPDLMRLTPLSQRHRVIASSTEYGCTIVVAPVDESVVDRIIFVSLGADRQMILEILYCISELVLPARIRFSSSDLSILS